MYRELAPPPDLAASVACVWSSVSRGGVILPDGCVDVVWRGDRLIVAGPATAAVAAGVPLGVPVFGVRFRLGAAGAALGLPAVELADAAVDAEEVFGRGASERVAAGGMPALLELVRARLRPVDPLDRAAALAMARPETRVASLAPELGVSERQLRRRFLDAVGYGPKTLGRILRFQHFLELSGRGSDLARLALDAGYADQAHLTREAKRLSGRTPAELIASGAGAAGERVRSVQAVGAPGAYRPAG
ncbi:helix-turn-helix transcriptional regulator [Solirubrobacter sp. CPCC 204708]|uniref:AraC family transcriptional regulator n=1 Tax=Solirubrobacter deserti TaxID=2282478 RepID=A0ABT4RGQ8_9ACTN|nr:AraC family transcriptional regulator [Solirubrobacter deserti]MBE2315428.1 helix-turn-helix transcriptional regulator [Solirubrobacter deserti]MDA0137730.1 AraC family transcriptional regulator [Solirubrobacter deserti]